MKCRLSLLYFHRRQMAKRNLKKLLSELDHLFPDIETRDSGRDSVHIDGAIPSSNEAWPSPDYYNSIAPVLAFLLGKGETEVSLDSCSPKDYHLLFQFEKIHYLSNWSMEFGHQIEHNYAVGQYPKVRKIKINNIRWIMAQETLERFFHIFPSLEKVEYVDNEDKGVLEEEAYGLSRKDARISAKKVSDLLGGIGFPFAW